MRIYELIITPDREEHSARHHVSAAEVEQVAYGTPFTSKTRQGRYRLIGQTDAGRYLTVFVAPRGQGAYGLVTARDATEAERKLYQERRRR